MAGKFLSLEEAARQLGVSVEEVNRLVDRKKLFPMRDGATIKFKSEEVERVGRSLGDESSMSGDLSLDLEMPDVAAPAGAAAAGSLSGLDADDIMLGDAIDAGESIFSTDASDVQTSSQTIVRGEAGAGGSVIGASHASGLSMASLGGASAADVVFGDSLIGETHESDELALESIIGASSPSLVQPADFSAPASAVAPALSDVDGTLAIDLSDIAGGPAAVGSLALGSGAELSGLSDAAGAGLSLSGALDSGLSLEDGDIQMSGVDLGAVGDEAAADGGTVLGGDDFELGGSSGDDESASVVIAAESETGDSSFFGATMVAEGSSFSDESAITGSVASEMVDMPYEMGREMTFSIWQTLGLVCCSLLLLFGGFIAYDLVRTIGSPGSTTLANPLLNAMADAFGWR